MCGREHTVSKNKRKCILYKISNFTDDTEPAHLPFTATPGCHVHASCVSPMQCFSLFFTAALWRFLVDNTNTYAQQKIQQMSPHNRSLYRNWRPVTMDEMKAVILNMGIIQMNNIKDYWRTDDTCNLPFFRSVFSRDRFLQIFGMLHVGDLDSAYTRDKIQPLLDRLLPSFQAAFTPSQAISIDESITSFRGRVSFRQYLKGKPNPWGVKAYCTVRQ